MLRPKLKAMHILTLIYSYSIYYFVILLVFWACFWSGQQSEGVIITYNTRILFRNRHEFDLCKMTGRDFCHLCFLLFPPDSWLWQQHVCTFMWISAHELRPFCAVGSRPCDGEAFGRSLMEMLFFQLKCSIRSNLKVSPLESSFDVITPYILWPFIWI